MFSNFTGAHRRPRVVNLGGSVRRSTPGDKQSLLDKTAKERAQREQTRKEEKAATTIQSFYRAKCDLSIQRDQVRNSWCNYLCQLWGLSSDKELEKLANSPQNTSILEFRHLGRWTPNMNQHAGEESLAKIPADRLVHLIRQFCFFYKGDDLFSFLLFCHLLVTIAESSRLLHLEKVYQSRKFSVSLMKILDVSKNLNTNSFAFFAAINVIDSLITHIPSETLFIDISLILTQARASGAHLSLAALAGLTSLICEKVTADPHDAYINFAAYLASTPFLFEIFPPNQLTAIRTHVSLPAVLLKTRQIAESGELMKKLHKICEISHKNGSGPLQALERCTWLLTQLVSWYRNTSPIPSKAENMIFSFVKTISQLLSTIFAYSAAAQRESNSQKKTVDQEDADPLDGVITSNKSVFSVLPVANEPFIVDNLDFLANRDFVEIVLSLADDVDPRNLSLYFVNMVHCWPSRRDDILLYLSIQQKSVLSIFYHALVEADFFRDSIDHKFSISDFQDSDQGSWTIVVILLELYSYWLIVFDDEEFFGMGGTGFSLSQVERLAKFLKEVAFLLVWNDNTYNDKLGGDDITYGRLKSLTVRVLTQIYIRDSRRRFLPKGFWLMTDKYDMSSFISSVVEEEQRIRSNRDNEESSETNQDNRTESRHRILRKANASKLRHELAVSPRLRILHSLPFFIPFNVRVSIFQEFIVLDRKQILNDPFTVYFSGMTGTHKADIRRDHLLEDAYSAFNNLGPEFKKPIQVQFFNEYGPEAGIDGGGITKEFLTSVCEYTLRPETKLFVSTPDHRFYPNPAATDRDSLALIEFFGRIIGKCLYEKILVEVQFAPFFLSKLQGRTMKNGIDDLYTYDPSLYNGLIQLKKYPGNVEEDLGLNFTVTEDVTLDDNINNNKKAAQLSPPPKTVELVPGGADIPVTNTNRLEYIYAFANYKLNTQISRQTNAFITGLADLISPSWLTMFNSEELQTLISGGEQTIDVTDWRKHTVYGGFWETDQTVQDFWQIVSEFSNDDRRKLLKFVTSVSRAPLLGFGMLQPLFSLRNAGPDKTRLPTTSTCVNLLKLPDYKDKKLLKQKMLYAINAEAGFDLS